MTNEITKTESTELVKRDTPINPFGSIVQFEDAQRIAKMLASSDIVPDLFKGNVANCMIAMDLSYMLSANVFAVMRNMYIIGGKPAFEAKFHIALINLSGRFTTLQYEYVGEQGTDSWGCRCKAFAKDTGEECIGPTVTIAIAKAEGWFNRSSSKWKTMPEQMLRYRSASWWCNTFSPETTMGIMHADEAMDIASEDYEPKPRGKKKVEAKAEIIEPKPEPVVDTSVAWFEKSKPIWDAIGTEPATEPVAEPEPVVAADENLIRKPSAVLTDDVVESLKKVPQTDEDPEDEELIKAPEPEPVADPETPPVNAKLQRLIDYAKSIYGDEWQGRLRGRCKLVNFAGYENLTAGQAEIMYVILSDKKGKKK